MEKSFWQAHKTGILVVIVVLVLIGWVVGNYNSFVVKNEAITNQWAQVDTQLQRRFDLIPNVVATVKGIAQQEQTVFGEIAEARTRYAGAVTSDEKAQAAGQVEGALARLLVIAENYPTLQSSQSFRDLTVELEGAEIEFSVERMRYNDLVRSFNASVKVFPGSVFASIFGFKERAYFEVSEGADAVPQVDFTE